MTGPKGNSKLRFSLTLNVPLGFALGNTEVFRGNGEFCFPETFTVSKGEAKGNIKGKQKSLFLVGPVFKCFVIPPNSKTEKICEEII